MVSPGTERERAKKVVKEERRTDEEEDEKEERDVKYNKQNLTQGVRKRNFQTPTMAPQN